MHVNQVGNARQVDVVCCVHGSDVRQTCEHESSSDVINVLFKFYSGHSPFPTLPVPLPVLQPAQRRYLEGRVAA